MGQASSREDSSSSISSRRSRLKQRFRSGSSSHHHNKQVAAGDLVGIALLSLIRAEMKFKDKWLACLSFGEQAFRTHISDQTDKPVWNSEKKLLLEKNGPRVARISVFETNKMHNNTLIGYCEIDLLDSLTRELQSDSSPECETMNLLDPSSPDKIVGEISVSISVEDPIDTEKSFARRILSIVDYNEDGHLSLSEFSDFMTAFGNQVAADKKEEMFKAADKNGDGVVSMDELAALLAIQQEKEPLINCCPVCGETLEVADTLNHMIHLSLCFDEGTGKQIMTGGFLTDKQANYGWMFKLSEWAHFSSYDVGLNSGSSGSHILVIDRRTKRLVEESIDAKIVLSMRAIYQSKLGLGLMDTGAKELLQSISEKQGRKMNSEESAKDIPNFIDFFKDELNMAEVKYPLEHFKTFNEFFVRELKPDARPIACPERDDIAVCGADCRLTAFKSIDDSLRFWIKGRKFSIQGLLGKDICSSTFTDGTLVIFRLAPQDYHRFHSPVSGTVEQFVNVPGCLYTVNPIAVNSKYCNVFTENKRVVTIISTAEFGKVAFVAIGATMVGSITFVKKEGDYVKKGDELGYFSFGGSTVICVFGKDAIDIDEDLLANSARSLETLVYVGMKLAEVEWNIKRELLLQIKVRSVDAKEALRLQKENNFVILDVRPVKEFNDAHPPNAINAQIYRLIKEWTAWDITRRAAFAFFGIFAGTEENPEFLQTVESNLDKKAKIIVACAAGGTMKPTQNLPEGQQSRSLIAAYLLVLNGYTNVFHLEGGLYSWFKEGLPIESDEE